MSHGVISVFIREILVGGGSAGYFERELSFCGRSVSVGSGGCRAGQCTWTQSGAWIPQCATPCSFPRSLRLYAHSNLYLTCVFCRI
jgi:hypothetical protein